MSKYTYETRTRTLEEVAQLLNLALEIKLLRGNKYVWQVKLKKLSFHCDNPLKRKYIICKAGNPNFAMAKLCEKISYKTVCAPQLDGTYKIVTLGLVERGHLYLRICEGF